ncbi:BnaC04g36780D [Brassica napus]|uniref:BnaC04g36780D protein n=1 Tax=Brassica napus TaxID=3708 RepID=A0A078G6J3_BRANA|nr:BnaC05g29800D [Brassica napus]CDY20278.1 BnaC04g36780D [Brassica napus]
MANQTAVATANPFLGSLQ